MRIKNSAFQNKHRRFDFAPTPHNSHMENKRTNLSGNFFFSQNLCQILSQLVVFGIISIELFPIITQTSEIRSSGRTWTWLLTSVLEWPRTKAMNISLFSTTASVTVERTPKTRTTNMGKVPIAGSLTKKTVLEWEEAWQTSFIG